MLTSTIDTDYCHRTLHKIHTFVEAQQEKIGIKQFFRQGEMNALLKNCTTGLDQAADVFMVNLVQFQLWADSTTLQQVNGVGLIKDISTMKDSAQRVHEEVLEFMSALSNENSSDSGSFVRKILI